MKVLEICGWVLGVILFTLALGDHPIWFLFFRSDETI